MIFGYNTDVKTEDVVYHVQTEDRGEKHPVIDSVIYMKGRIVDRRRTSYQPGETTPDQLQEMVKGQHRELVEAIRGGTYVPPEQAPAPTAAAAEKHQAPAPAAAAEKQQSPAPAAAAEKQQSPAPPAPVAQPAPSPPALELTNASEIEQDGRLLFRLRLCDRASGQPLPGAVVRAVLAPGEEQEARGEATTSAEGMAEVGFEPPSAEGGVVLFQAAAGGVSEVVKFRLLRSPEQ